MTVYITGDRHGAYSGIIAWGKMMNLTSEDTVIVLGDNGVNFIMGWVDYKLRKKLGKCAWNWFLIRGNHDMRPEDAFNRTPADAYQGECSNPRAHTEVWFDNEVLVENEMNSNIKYAIDGNIYTINGEKCLVIGGGYSTDKWYRLENSIPWFLNEQLSSEEMDAIYQIYCANHVDVILSHVAPVSYETDIRHLWMDSGGIKNGAENIDKTMEIWMNKFLWDEVNVIKRWYFGHCHANINCADGSGVMLYDVAIPFGDKAPDLYTLENDVRTEKQKKKVQSIFVTEVKLCSECGRIKDKPGVPYRCQAYLAGICPD